MSGAAARLWRCRWGVIRLAAAGFMLWAFVAGTAGRLTRLQLAALPGMDFAAEVRHLREAGRHGEAAVIAEAALAAETDPQKRAAIERERDAAAAEGASVVRRLREVGMGALSGRAESIEGLVGAVGADMLVVGDVRDLLIEGGKWALDGEADEVILALSAVGVATTLAPEVDWAPSVLKAAKRAGAMTKGLGEFIVRAAKGGKVEELRELMGHVAALARRASPGGAVRILRLADGPEDVARLAKFVDRAEDLGKGSGVLALHVTGKEGARVVKAAEGMADSATAVRAADRLVVSAARKGPAGAAWLRLHGAKRLLRPHPLLGLVKGVYKGNVQELAVRVAAATDRHAWWIIPLLAVWVFAEGVWIVRRVTGRGFTTEHTESTERSG